MKRALLLATLVAAGTILPAQSPDRAVLSALKQADPNLTYPTVIHRAHVNETMDVVLALGGSYEVPACCRNYVWGAEQKLGLFLQERARVDRVYALAIETGNEGCFATVQRATVTDTVISCDAEKSSRLPTRKFVYDVRAKSLVKSFSYEPVSMSYQVRRERNSVVFGVARRALEIDFVPGREPEFGLRGANRETEDAFSSRPFTPVTFGPAGTFRMIQETERSNEPKFVIVEEQNGRSVRYPVPLLTAEELKIYRATPDVEPGSLPTQELGAWAVDGNTLWFGRSYYAGEGSTGFPGFGYFDASTRKFRLLVPKEIDGWSISAMDVAPETVWLSLRDRLEFGDGSGGLLRFDRRSETIRTVSSSDAPDLGLEFVRIGSRLLLVTEVGITSVEPGPIARYFVDQTTDGRLRIVEARK